MVSRSVVLTVSCLFIIFGLLFALGLPGGESRQKAPSAGLSERPIAVNGGEIGQMLREWYSEGTAAGNIGDYYDNRDGGHSNLNMKPYPQLQRVEYSEEQIEKLEHWSVQKKILPYVVFGNSSTSAPLDRGGSNVRRYYTHPDGLEFLFTQYVQNNLYIYPEHRDHDPGDNGVGGYGDLFPTNTPYLIASQGSFGSDQAFMRAMPYVLAAFRPEVKKRLIQTGMLMPAIQMILRITNKQLSKHEEYLTGKAHPTVFRGSDINVKQMIEMAHGITLSTTPPLALLKVIKEDTPANGIDYFEPEQTEILANTPAVIARIFRGANPVRIMTVSAQGSGDLNKRPLKFYWIVLRGDPNRIQIEYLNQAHSVAEITTPYFRRAPIAEGSGLESNRVDIGVFVHNGIYYSPPAFITFYTLDSETRSYRPDGRPLEIAHDVETSTVSVADWGAFFDALDPSSQSWPSQFLRKQFKFEEIAGLSRVSEEFCKIHAELLAARQKQEQVNAAAEAANHVVKTIEVKHTTAQTLYRIERNEENKNSLAQITQELNGVRESYKHALAATRAALDTVNAAQKSGKELLEKRIPNLNRSTFTLVQEVLDSMLRDPDLWVADEEELELVYNAAGKEARAAYDKVKKTLILFGMGEDSEGIVFRLNPIRGSGTPYEDRLTPYEKSMAANLNAILLSRIVFPEIMNSENRARFVDHRIVSVKEWRDVYRYAPDGTPMGWRRYQLDSVSEFNADGLLVLEKDSQGRCIRARLVRYELEAQKKDSQGRPIEYSRRKVRMIPTDMLREYEYEGANDWKGHIKQRYLAK